MPAPAFGIEAALAQGRHLDPPDVVGDIKTREEDFLVEEIPLYQPSGEGEHLYLFLQKEGLAHSELLRALASHFKVKEFAIGSAGMKDRHAITRQMVSIHLPGREPSSVQPRHPAIQVLWSARHQNKLRRGHLRGNRFSIRIRNTDPLKAPSILSRLRVLEQAGVPNYYGMQRFGYRYNTHRLGALLLRERWDDLLGELLGATGTRFPERQRGGREKFDAGRYKDSLSSWSRNEQAERRALQALIKGRSAKEAVLSISRPMLAFWMSALQSAIFNRTLDQRLDDGLLDKVELGDVAIRHDSRRQFICHPEILEAPGFDEEVRGFEVSATGPMWGHHMLRPFGTQMDHEVTAIRAMGCSPEEMESSRFIERGTRRPFRVAVTNIEIDSGVDGHGPYIRTAFDLPRGAYATVVLRELICGIDPVEGGPWSSDSGGDDDDDSNEDQ